jgi:uncharacterized protein YuzE
MSSTGINKGKEHIMRYKIKYQQDADVLVIIVREKGELSHAKEMGDFIVHVNGTGEPLFMEILKASKIVPLLVEGLAKNNSPLPNQQLTADKSYICHMLYA